MSTPQPGDLVVFFGIDGEAATSNPSLLIKTEHVLDDGKPYKNHHVLIDGNLTIWPDPPWHPAKHE
jgi:hypothetical protein